ncbi:MAG TPA: hypothetical protein VMJ34_22260 [Bryobacteraceae bacterium]|nr:hypothetical protein [Bryobacteraceae bacterium]
MGSAVSGLGSFDPTNLIRSTTPTASSATSAVKTRSVSAKQEQAALQESGQGESLLSGSIAAGVLQITNPPPATPVAEADVSNQMNQVIAAYTTPPEGDNTAHQSAATWPSNPALALLQALENAGVLGPEAFKQAAG